MKIFEASILFFTLVCSGGKLVLGAKNYEPVAEKVKATCASFESSVKTLESFREFRSDYEKLTTCLRQTEAKAIHLDKCQESEQVCQDNGILFSTVGAIGSLLSRVESIEERTCTVEFAIRLYRLACRLVESPLVLVLRKLGQLWSTRCRQTAVSRLLEVEQRAPEARKHLLFILGIMSYGLNKDEGNAELHQEVDDFVPVLEDELQQESDISFATRKGNQPWSGFEFKIDSTIRLALNGAQISCRSLKPYYINILGSLGLVASVGMGSDATSKKPLELSDRLRLQEWLMAATVCQSLSTITKMVKVNNEGKTSSWVKMVPIREADISIEKERDQEFASYKLDELNQAPDLSKATIKDSKPKFTSSASRLRKLQMVEGPNERLARAIYDFIDMKQPERWKLPYRVLGRNPTVQQEDEQDDDDDDDNDDIDDKGDEDNDEE